MDNNINSPESDNLLSLKEFVFSDEVYRSYNKITPLEPIRNSNWRMKDKDYDPYVKHVHKIFCKLNKNSEWEIIIEKLKEFLKAKNIDIHNSNYCTFLSNYPFNYDCIINDFPNKPFIFEICITFHDEEEDMLVIEVIETKNRYNTKFVEIANEIPKILGTEYIDGEFEIYVLDYPQLPFYQ